MVAWTLLSLAGVGPAEAAPCSVTEVRRAATPEDRDAAWAVFLACADDDDELLKGLRQLREEEGATRRAWSVVLADRAAALREGYVDVGALGRYCAEPEFARLLDTDLARSGALDAIQRCNEPTEAIREQVRAWMADEPAPDCKGCRMQKALWQVSTEFALFHGFAPPGTAEQLETRLQRRVQEGTRGAVATHNLVQLYLATQCPGWSAHREGMGAAPTLATVPCNEDALAWLGTLAADRPPREDRAFADVLTGVVGPVRMCRSSLGDALARAYHRGDKDVVEVCKEPTPVPIPWMLEAMGDLDWLVKAHAQRNQYRLSFEPPPFDELVHVVARTHPPAVAAEQLMQVWTRILTDIGSPANLSRPLMVVERAAPGTVAPIARDGLTDAPTWVAHQVARNFVAESQRALGVDIALPDGCASETLRTGPVADAPDAFIALLDCAADPARAYATAMAATWRDAEQHAALEIAHRMVDAGHPEIVADTWARRLGPRRPLHSDALGPWCDALDDLPDVLQRRALAGPPAFGRYGDGSEFAELLKYFTKGCEGSP